MINILEILNSQTSRINFIKGLIYLSRAQEISEAKKGIDPEERVFLRNAMISLGINEEEMGKLENLIDLDEINIDLVFDNKRQALFFLREGIQVCYVDGQYTQPEKDMIYNMGNLLGIDKGHIISIEEWVLEGIEWAERGNKFLEVED
jgi:hypothetical protein